MRGFRADSPGRRVLRLTGGPGDPTREVVFPVRWIVGKDGERWALQRLDWRERRGVIRVGTVVYGFALRSTMPRFDGAGALVGIDLDTDGTVDFEEGSREVFPAEDRMVVIGGEEYQAGIDPYGDRLRLLATGRFVGERPPLTAGTSAPTLEDGLPLSLARGRPVLLEFWSPHCSFSKRMAPRVGEASGEFDDVVFVSITDVDDAGSRGFGWRHLDGEPGGRLFRLYRVTSLPTYYVIDAEGRIRARGHTLDWSRIRAALAMVSDAADRGGAR